MAHSTKVRLGIVGGLALAGLTAGGGVVVALLAGASAQAAGTCSIYWTGKVSTAWATPGNWASDAGGVTAAGHVPGTADFVCMATAPTTPNVVYSAANRTIAGIQFATTGTVTPALDVQGGVFTLNTNASTLNNLTFDGGTLAGSATVDLTGTVSAGSGSITLLGAAKTITVGATATITTSVTIGAATANGAASLVNNGNLTVNGTVLTLSTVPNAVATPVRLTNAGSMTLAAGASVFTGGSAARAPAFVNSGSLTNSGVQDTTIQVPFTNTGTVTVGATTIHVQGANAVGTTDTGTWNTGSTAGAQISYEATRTATAGTFTGAAGLRVSSGTATFSAGVTIGNLDVEGGTVSGSPSASKADLTAGTLTGSGTLTTTGTGTTLCNITIDSGYRLLNTGSASFDTSCGYTSLTAGGRIENAGQFTITGNGGGYLTDDANPADGFTNDAAATLTITLTTGTDTTQIATPFTNNGTVTATTGTLHLLDGNVSSTTDTGTFTLSAGTGVSLDGGARTLAAVTATGTGTLTAGGATITFTGAPTISNLAVTAGSITGPASAGTATLTAGTLTGSGTLTTTGTGTTLCNITIDSGYRLLNTGSASFDTSCGYTSLTAGGRIENAGQFTITGNGGGYLTDDANPADGFTNDAAATLTITLTTGTDTTQIATPFTNNGTVTATTGTLHLLDGNVSSTTDTGTFTLSAGTGVSLDGGARTLAAVTATGTGTLTAGGATITFTGAPTISNLAVTAGSITGPASAGTATLTAGTLTGSGTLTTTGTGTTLCNITIDSGYRLLNTGSASFDTSCGYTSLTAGGRIENAGQFTITGNGGGYLTDDANPADGFTNDAAATLTITLTTGTDTTQIATPFTNNGTVTATKGTVTLTAVTNLAGGGVLTGGTWNAAGGTIVLPRTVTTNAATVSIGATGAITATTTSGAAFATMATNTGSFTTAQNLTTTTALATSGTLTVTAGTLRANSITQTAGTTTVAAGALLKAGATGTAAVTINGGTLTGSGTVQGNVTGTGIVAPGIGGAGTLSVTGTYAGAAASTFTPTVGATSSKLAMTGAATLTGKLSITTATPAPTIGTSFTVLSAASRTGTFATVTNQDVPSAGGYWAVGYTATSVTLTLTPYPTISVSGGSIAEGNSGTTNLTFTATLSAASPVQATAAYSTADGTAVAPGDYTASAGSLTFTPGVTTQTFTVPVIGDVLFENDETFTASLSSAVGATVTGGPATGTIVNDDAAPTISIADAGGATSGAGGSTINFPVTLSAPSGLAASVHYATQDGTAAAPGDYTSTSGTLTIPAGSTTATVSVTVLAQAGYAPPKTFTVLLTAPTNATIGTATATGTITNGNPQGPVVAGVTPGAAAQGTSVQVTVSGTNFAADATVGVSGSGVTVSGTTVVNATSITATLTVSGTAATGARNVTVAQTGSTTGTCTGCFTVTARPTVTAIDHPAFAKGNVDVVVTVTGSGFAPGASLALTRASTTLLADSTTVNGPTSLTAVLRVPPAAVLGNYAVVVTNLDGGSGTRANAATVFAAPKITGVSPATLARGTSTPVTFTGTGFVAGAVVSIIGCSLSNVVVVNGTTITATVTVYTTAATGTKPVKVFNPAAAGSGTGSFTGVTIT